MHKRPHRSQPWGWGLTNAADSDRISGPPRVLLVDDQRIMAEALRRMLSAVHGLEFFHCGKGDEALATALRVAPSVILQDLVMPDADGLELLRDYRAAAEFIHTPIVVLSSKDEPQTKARAFALGANDYLVKLPDPVELIARIRYHSRSYYLHLRAAEMAEAEKRILISERQRVQLKARNTLIFGLAKLAESRDSETGDHLERIEAYCRVLAEQLREVLPDLTDEWIVNLQLASSLHDIGKVGVPDAVLLKPGKLTAEERVLIERHPRIGADALASILERDPGDELLRMARNIAAFHHERWDGTGYPSRLAGDAIPLEARIVSVADVYDALTSRRVYKPPMPHERAVEIIRAGSGTQFDPQIVEALVACEIVFQQSGMLLRRGTPAAEDDTHGRPDSEIRP